MRALILLLAGLAAGCTARSDLAYAPPASPPGFADPVVAEVHVVDQRGVAPRSVGAVMGIDGTPLKRLETDQPTAEVVARAFGEALAARGDLAPPGGGRFDLYVTILALGGEQWAERHGEADLQVRLVDRETGREVWSARTGVLSRGDNYLAVDNFEFGSPAALGKVTDGVLNRAINDTLGQGGFALALRQATGPHPALSGEGKRA